MPGALGRVSGGQDPGNNAHLSSLPPGDAYETPRHLFTFPFRKLIKHLQSRPSGMEGGALSSKSVWVFEVDTEPAVKGRRAVGDI